MKLGKNVANKNNYPSYQVLSFPYICSLSPNQHRFLALPLYFFPFLSFFLSFIYSLFISVRHFKFGKKKKEKWWHLMARHGAFVLIGVSVVVGSSFETNNFLLCFNSLHVFGCWICCKYLIFQKIAVTFFY